VKRLHVERDQCTGCESCVLTCSFEHEERFGLHLSRIRVRRDEENADFAPMVCIQCDEHPCVTVCPVDALSIDPGTGAIAVSVETCTGCKACQGACPYGGVHFAEGITFPFICDLCGGDPQCVQVCQLPQAIQVVDRE